MEAANVVFVPASGIFVAGGLHAAIEPAMWLAMAATAWLLAAGTAALRMALAQLERRHSFAQRLLGIAALAKWPGLALVIGAAAATLHTCWQSGGVAGHWGAIGYTLLAGLEFVNYYVVQLQHFDNAADWQRLRSGRGFREAHLARALRLRHRG